MKLGDFIDQLIKIWDEEGSNIEVKLPQVFDDESGEQICYNADVTYVELEDGVVVVY